MATPLENAIIVRDNILARLAECTAQVKPTHSEDGLSTDWTGYQSMLMTQLKEANALIQTLEGPWEIRSRAVT